MEVQHGDMTVTSEERVLDVILTWCMGACETFHWTSVDELLRTSTPEQLFGERHWTSVDELLRTSTPEQLFGERLSAINTLLPLLRFPLMQLSTLKRVHTVFLVIQFYCEATCAELNLFGLQYCLLFHCRWREVI
jgi:hypothetical protein